ncbi:MAG: AAA family ATPase [Jaaginema sp. PMC 1079.18]|nr:AAA family ATPase [Jaaginema sp. PMC 1080.18]MEC4852395.1 AAA family ATPase [Jaaginema sp. PMC 1079.18]MEC4864581.1 AAA family ATPase [Jaaginema sp. PMC 1078.18]
MNIPLTNITAKNYRCLANISVRTNALNVLFGPNGVGKSTFLDTIWFLRDCAIRGVEFASSDRDHGIGLFWDQAEEEERIIIELESTLARYQVSFGYSAGRIESFVGEQLVDKKVDNLIIDRTIGSNRALFKIGESEAKPNALKDPEKLALTKYVELDQSNPIAAEIDDLLRQVRFYSSRSYPLYKLKKFGSESDYSDRLQDRAENLWSVLRNLHDRSVIDDRYNTIIQFMREAFPNFENLYFEQTGRLSIYAYFLDKKRRKPIQASGISDGHLQLLINLTALFSEGRNKTLILMDEPETSLHPWALAILGKAVKLATEEWNKQVFIATHSPVLLSQFEAKHILAVELDERGQTVIKRVSKIVEIQDLLENYALGSLYMAEMVAPQSQSGMKEEKV